MTDQIVQLDLKRLLAGAIWATFKDDPKFLSYAVSELTAVAPIYARMYSAGFSGYAIDAEYDREGIDGAFKSGRVDPSGQWRDWVRPDLIVHQRGHDQGNLLVVEFKLRTDDQGDQGKVRRMMGGERHYQFGATVVLNPPAGPPSWRWFDTETAANVLVEVPRPHEI